MTVAGAEKNRGGPLGEKKLLIVADIEGSSQCRSYAASSFLTGEWARACAGMTEDVDAVVKALFRSGIRDITVKDFHRTGFNLLPEKLDPRATLVSGYKTGTVPGIGAVDGTDSVLFLGMHAGSGSNGFLPHTFTSRIRKITVNGRPVSEVELFSAALALAGVRPVFFSGCPVACRQAEDAIPGIQTFAIEKFREGFSPRAWREQLANAAVAAVGSDTGAIFRMKGPIHAVITFRDGPSMARRLAHRWNLKHRGADVIIDSYAFSDFYHSLIHLCYLTPLSLRYLPVALSAYHTVGRAGRWWVRAKLAGY